MKARIVITVILFLGIGFWLGQEKNNYIEKSTVEKELTFINPDKGLAKNVRSKEAVYLSPGRSVTVLDGTSKSFQTVSEAPSRYRQNNLPAGEKDLIYSQYWAGPGTIKSLRRGEPLFKNDKIKLLIQTFTWAPTGLRYSFDNLDLVEKPLKLKSGLYAYVSRFEPPTAVVVVSKRQYIIVSSDSPKILLRALNSLELD